MLSKLNLMPIRCDSLDLFWFEFILKFVCFECRNWRVICVLLSTGTVITICVPLFPSDQRMTTSCKFNKFWFGFYFHFVSQKFDWIVHCLYMFILPLDVKVIPRPPHIPPDSFQQLHTFAPHNTFACDFCKLYFYSYSLNWLFRLLFFCSFSSVCL